jgi:HAD superfamily hydrolase (TIGR01509 family)
MRMNGRADRRNTLQRPSVSWQASPERSICKQVGAPELPCSVVPPSLLIFDCDGVLVDSEPISQAVLHRMLQGVGVAISPEECMLRFLGTSGAGLITEVTELCGGAAPPNFLERFRAESLAQLERDLQPIAGVARLLQNLHTPFCVASNGRRVKMTATLANVGLLHHFSGRMFSSEDVLRPKPAPDLFLHACGTMGIAPSACTVVEDSPTGVRAARAAGMRAVGFAARTPRRHLMDAGAHITVESMQQLAVVLRLPP